jgi:polar amino acid transport system permease protein
MSGDWSVQFQRLFTYSNILFLLEGIKATVLLTLFGCVIGASIGFVLVFLRKTTTIFLLPVRVIIVIYVEFFRRIPFLIILFIVLFAVQAIDQTASLFLIAVIAVCLLTTAFLSEIIRAGFESVPQRQIEAATALNFTWPQIVFNVIVPQAWKVILPPGVSYAVMFIKDSSLASQVGVVELTFVGKVFDGRGIPATLVFGTVLICYFLLSYPLARLGAWLETKLASS